MRREKQIVKEFYETFGWRKNAEGVYHDTALFVDRRPVLEQYQHKVHLRVKNFIAPQGDYFLDAGSGAIAHPESLEYSAGYHRRVCVDLSVQALSEARAKLKDRGLYVVADLTHLPFRDGTFESTVCAHVLYHVPQDEQESAIREFYRTLKNNGRCVIVYTWPTSLPTALTRLFGRMRRTMGMLPGVHFLKQALGKSPGQAASQRKGEQPQRPPLYFHPHDSQWFQRVLPRNWKIEIRCWRSVDEGFTKTFVRNNALGRFLMELIFRIETLFPHALAKVGKYPMIIIQK